MNKHVCIEYDGAHLCCIEVTGDRVSDAKIAASQIEVAIRAWPHKVTPKRALQLVTRAMSAAIRGVSCPHTGSFFGCAPRDEALELLIAVAFVEQHGPERIERLFRELARNRRIADVERDLRLN